MVSLNRAFLMSKLQSRVLALHIPVLSAIPRSGEGRTSPVTLPGIAVLPHQGFASGN